MAHHIYKKIEFTGGQVFITGSDNNLYPRFYRRWEVTSLNGMSLDEQKAIIRSEKKNGNLKRY